MTDATTVTGPTVGQRITGTADAPIQDGLTRGLLSGVLLEAADLAGLDPASVIADYPSLFAVALMLTWGIVDYGLKFAARRGITLGG